ncbi:kinesin family member 12 [Reticulomyxa filosa]|uniref:Kinesin family member 12 n=1 Tax=Reticulomyxa filosa TaxID=46433 RepID=X6LJE4_RETFI|nr:kinesin family member 12 [Reticulomyxa filosa]|eukprot:ETO01262.1 kinesin family member 12 [Reticulomyxa filosa]
MIMKKFEELEKLEKAKHEVECRIFLIQQEKRPSGLNKIEASDEEMEKEKENTKEHAKEQEQGQGQEREQDREKEKEAKTSVLTEEDMAKLFRQTSSYTVQSVLNNNTLFYPKPARSEESEDDTNTDEDVIQHFQRAAGFNMSENDSELSLLNIFAGHY